MELGLHFSARIGGRCPRPAVYTKATGWGNEPALRRLTLVAVMTVVDPRAYDGERMLAVYAVDLFTVINHYKVIDYLILTIGTGGFRLSRAIRIDGIGPGVLVPTGVERITIDNCVLQPRLTAIAIVMSRGCCDERKLGCPEDERAMDGTAVIALNGLLEQD